MELDAAELIGGVFRDGKSGLSVGSDRVGDALQQGVLGLQQFVLAREELEDLIVHNKVHSFNIKFGEK